METEQHEGTEFIKGITFVQRVKRYRVFELARSRIITRMIFSKQVLLSVEQDNKYKNCFVLKGSRIKDDL